MVQSVGHSEHGVSLTDSINTPPAAVEAERSLLGALMLVSHAWDRITGRVSAEDFYRPDHRLIFAAIRELADQGQPLDPVTVSEFLERRGEIIDAGGLGYLGQLVADTPSAANIRSYADIVRERALLRELIEVGNNTCCQYSYSPLHLTAE